MYIVHQCNIIKRDKRRSIAIHSLELANIQSKPIKLMYVSLSATA